MLAKNENDERHQIVFICSRTCTTLKWIEDIGYTSNLLRKT